MLDKRHKDRGPPVLASCRGCQKKKPVERVVKEKKENGRDGWLLRHESAAAAVNI